MNLSDSGTLHNVGAQSGTEGEGSSTTSFPQHADVTRVKQMVESAAASGTLALELIQLKQSPGARRKIATHHTQFDV